jgi:putative SOS response-associated peptidase YedK
MPAALALDVADRWLTPAILTPQDALALLAPSDGNLWTYHRVGRAVGNARIDRPELIDPVNAESEPSDQLELFG